MRHVCDSVAAAGGLLLTFILGMRCDETPQTVTIVDPGLGFDLHDPLFSEEVNAAFETQLEQSQRDAPPAKLLNAEYVVSLLCVLNMKARLFIWRPPLPYQPMTKTTSSGYFNAWKFAEAPFDFEAFAARFLNVLRWICLDGDSSPARADRALALDPSAGTLAVRAWLFVCLESFCASQRLCSSH